MQSLIGTGAASLRPATPEDATAIAAIYAPSIQHSSISFEYEVPSTEEMRERILTTLSATPWLVCERAGEVVGYAYASKHRERAAYQWSADASVYVHASAHRLGIGRALYGALFALTRLQGYYAIHAGIALPNAPSVALHEALGFTRIGLYPDVGYKQGAWHTVGWWQLELRPRVGAPQPIAPWPTVWETKRRDADEILAAAGPA